MVVSPEVLQIIRSHAEATYPEECCGFLLGHVLDDENHVRGLHEAENRQAELRETRYRITARDYVSATRSADELGMDIVGFYHSHPDHPARPSPTDLEEATFPGFTYVIVSVRDGLSQELTAWSLAQDRSRFDPEPIEEKEEDSK